MTNSQMGTTFQFPEEECEVQGLRETRSRWSEAATRIQVSPAPQWAMPTASTHPAFS